MAFPVVNNPQIFCLRTEMAQLDKEERENNIEF